jgi:hypothetical protein
MKYAFQMGSGAIIYQRIPSLIKIISGIHKVIEGIHTQHGDRISLLLFLNYGKWDDCLCGLVVRVLGYRSKSPGSIPRATRLSEK